VARRIPIRNLYYLLCYAWDVLEERDDTLVSELHDWKVRGSEKITSACSTSSHAHGPGLDLVDGGRRDALLDRGVRSGRRQGSSAWDRGGGSRNVPVVITAP
jgi:hypothetical protein